MKKFLHPFVFVLAVILVFEEWLWDTLKAQLMRLRYLPWVARVQTELQRLDPWSSLLVLLLPAIVLVPFKIAALYLISHHHPVLGILALLAAKLCGTALAAYLFDLVRDNARKLYWFNILYLRVMQLLAGTKEWLRRQPSYLWVQQQTAKMKTWIHGQGRMQSWLLRKLQSAKLLVQKNNVSQ